MARGAARSPSPAGSLGSKRRRREDKRYARDRRDDDRRHRRRSRSPVGDDSYRRDSRRLNADRNHGSRRDRSRDRDERRYKDSRDDDRSRRKHDDAVDSRYRSKHGDHNDGRGTRGDDLSSRGSASKPGTPLHGEEEDKKAERLARLEAWKQKQESRGKERTGKDADARSVPESAPAAYAGKFDPKAVAKKAATKATLGNGALGGDVSVPQGSAAYSASSATLSKSKPSAAAVKQSFKDQGKVSGFGLGSKTLNGPGKSLTKGNLDFGDEVAKKRKLEKLPNLPDINSTPDAAPYANDAAQDDDDGNEFDDLDDEEAEMAAARAAAQRRDQQQIVDDADAANRMDVDSGLSATAEKEAEAQDATADGEDVDPLDDFMTDLQKNPQPDAPGLGKSIGKRKQPGEDQTLFNDDGDDMTAVDTNIFYDPSKKDKRKELPVPDHSKIHYEDFRRSFYVEPEELREMNDEEVSELRHELDGIKVRGQDVPKPVTRWSYFGLGVQSLNVIQNLGFESPTSIQAQSVPAIMSGRDVIGIAKTGSGKTMAFLLPMFRHIKDQRPLEAMEGPVGLILAPTRELATQIHRECKPWLKALQLRAVCAYGGAPIKDQIAELKRGAEIVVCTPGRIIDLLFANSGRVLNLRRVTYLVMDEADRMFDMGFEPQITKILKNIRPSRQTVLFSATFPRSMEALARKNLKSPVEIIVGGRSVVPPEIKQVVEVRPENSKFLRTLQLLGEIHEDEEARSLVFVDRQDSAEELASAIMRKGYPCFTIHGGKDQSDRDSVISDFKVGIFPVLVATSVAARGLDVKDLKMVINFDCPNHLEDYVHRAGRTGRAGNTGLAVTFITEEQARYASSIAKALKQSEQEVPEALQSLVDAFQKKLSAGEEKWAARGFGGRGIQALDQKREKGRMAERKKYNIMDDAEADKDEDEEEKAERNEEDKEKGREKETEKSVVKADSPGTSSATPVKGVPENIHLDGEIKVHKTERPEKGQDRMGDVALRVQNINARLRATGNIRGTAPIDNKGPDAGAYHSTLEINDFPQKARWAVTNRTNVAKILDTTGTSITTKGNFYPTGKAPGPNDMPKLYILVEGDTEVVVTQAITELRRLLRQGTETAMESEARAPAAGRYSVV